MGEVILPLRAGNFSREHLWRQARWIRDELDPRIAVDGQDILQSDEVLTLDEFLRNILDSNLSLEDIRHSRIHLAIEAIAGTATRWPTKLIGRCDTIKDRWETKYGPLKLFKIPLYEPGGRLHGICTPDDWSKERLLIKWLKSPAARLSPAVARKHGHLGFIPGDWWISALFAHHAGIIDSPDSRGGIVSDAHGAYAIVMTGEDEVWSNSPEVLRYRARSRDPGRYRLTTAGPESRRQVRILRSHTLHSFWRPRAGVRYDGLFQVKGWTLQKDPKTLEAVYDIEFVRVPDQVSMRGILQRPWADEVEDYKEYRRLQKNYRFTEMRQLQLQYQHTPAPMCERFADGYFDLCKHEVA